jgi:branched-chain amino acid transport system substrate-binding protein
MKELNRIAFIALALFFLSACSRSVTVKIGVVGPMTGSLAAFGQDMAKGSEVAVDEMNKDMFMIGGKRARFELVVEDDVADAEKGKAAAKRLIDAGVVAVFGHLNSGVSIAAAPLYANAGIPQLSVSTNPKYTRMGLKTAFRITADDIQQGNTLGRLMSDKLRAKSIYMVDDRTPFGVGLAVEVDKVFKLKQMNVTHESIDPKGADFEALAKAIQEKNYDVVFMSGDEGFGLPLLKAMRKLGSSAKFVTADAMCDQSSLKNAAGAADSNFYCTVAGVPPSWLSGGIGFTELYKAKFGAPGAYSTLAYDGIHVLAQAMQQANSINPATYLPEMTKGSFDGKVQGTVEFDSKGDIKEGTVVIYQSIGGQLIEQRNLL